MELIKEIKKAESKAQEIIEEAKSDAVELAQKNKQSRLELMTKAQQERIAAIDSSVASGESEGFEEIEKLKSQAENDCNQLRQKTAGKIDAAAKKVLSYLKG